MTIERGLGWRPDDDALVGAELMMKSAAVHLLGQSEPVRASVLNYASLLDGVPDQRNTSSCVGQAFSTALFVGAKLAGHPIPRPSAKAIYDYARGEDQPYVELVDDGSRPLAAIKCLTEKGMVSNDPIEGWPLLFHPDGMSNVNVRPPLDIYQSALAAKVGSYYRIPAGFGASEMVRRALAAGYVPVFAMPVDSTYMWWKGDGVYEGRKGGILGWHMQSTIGFLDGATLIATSWGPSHGDTGIVAIANDYFDSGECKDIIVSKVIPRQLAA